MKTVIMKAYKEGKLVGHLRVGEHRANCSKTEVGSIMCKLAKHKDWMNWEREGWFKFPTWDKLEIVDCC